MVTSSPSPSPSAPRRSVVRSLATAAERTCARPGCPAPARATLTFVYGAREVRLDRLTDERDPQAYDLCGSHASRTEAPRGWDLTDLRPVEDLAPEPVRTARDLGGEATVAVLAAALRSVPEPAVEPEPSPLPDAASVEGDPAPRAATARRTALEDTVEIPVARPVPAADGRDRRRPATDW